jgi:hypothetical protein
VAAIDKHCDERCACCNKPLSFSFSLLLLLLLVLLSLLTPLSLLPLLLLLLLLQLDLVPAALGSRGCARCCGCAVAAVLSVSCQVDDCRRRRWLLGCSLLANNLCADGWVCGGSKQWVTGEWVGSRVQAAARCLCDKPHLELPLDLQLAAAVLVACCVLLIFLLRGEDIVGQVYDPIIIIIL